MPEANRTLDPALLEGTATRFALRVEDAPSGLRGFVCIQDPDAGPAFGGIRLAAYAAEAEALHDAALLARAMHRKVRAAGLPCGGAKSAFVLHPGLRRREALLAIGRAVEDLGGRYHAGPDMGIAPDDLRTIREATRHCADPDSLGDLGEATARGVLAAIRAGVLHALRRPTLEGLRVSVQGLGGVGRRLVEGLVREGAILTASDVDPAAAEATRAAAELVRPGRFRLGDPRTVLEEPCDVLAPCARGGVLGAAAIGRLRCRVVAGAANNMLESDADADRLAARGILYVPDFVSNAGAVITGARRALFDDPDPTGSIDAIEARVAWLLARAESEGRTPWALACEEADAPGVGAAPRVPRPRT